MRRILSEVLWRKNGVVQHEWPGRSTSDRMLFICGEAANDLIRDERAGIVNCSEWMRLRLICLLFLKARSVPPAAADSSFGPFVPIVRT
jgi:hypothetical protein